MNNNITDILSKSIIVESIGNEQKKNRLIRQALVAIAGMTLLTAFLLHPEKSLAHKDKTLKIEQNFESQKELDNNIEKVIQSSTSQTKTSNDNTTKSSDSTTITNSNNEDEENIINSRNAIDKLNLNISDNRDSIVQKSLQHNENFMAFAVRLEDIKTTVYYDPGGANIGAGFCITKQLSTHSRDEVIKMLEDAKIDHNTAVELTNPKITDLKRHNKKLAKGLNISPESALILTKSLQKTYQSTLISAFDSVGVSMNPKKGDNQGQDLFNKLSPNEKAAYTWLNYNADISKFKRLIRAIYVLHGEDSTIKQKAIAKNIIIKNLAPMYRENGTLVKNTRAEAYLVSGMYDQVALSYALTNPQEIESRQGNITSLGKYLQNIKNKENTNIAIQSLEEKGITTKESIKEKIKNQSKENEKNKQKTNQLKK